jgi:site-specific DNA-methyltransferase (adenine-specific)
MGLNIGDGFPVLLTDCPWDYKNAQNHDPARGGTPYEPMKIEDLCALTPLIQAVAAPDCILFHWATGPKMKEAIHVMEAWGFIYTTMAFNWVKLNGRGKIIVPDHNLIVMNSPDQQDGFTLTPKDMILKGGIRSGQGYYTNTDSEFVLLGKRGKTSHLRASKSVKQPVFWPEAEPIITPIAGHSSKPEEVRSRIEELTGNIPGLELFARPPARVPGWVKIGWEIDGQDISVMLQQLIDGEYRRPPNG